MAHAITKDNLQQALEGGKPVVIDFWAEWCGPCRMIGPIVEQIADEYKGKAAVGKVDVDHEPKLAERFGVMSIPTLIVFKDGEPADRIVGAVPRQHLKQALDKAI